ncbi:MAG: PSD1 and planctomycete cytochrome C domain-containing protein [Isosphaeraceae bacterium]
MRRIRTTLLLVWIVNTWIGMAAYSASPPDDPEGVAFFERKIRPVLVRECYSCHAEGAKSIKAGLRLDTRDGMLTGGDSGPVLEPGKPDESLLLDALRHDGIEMPPTSRLPETVVADFERWVTMGAPDPRVDDGPKTPSASPTVDVEAGRSFWAFQAPRAHQPPEVADPSWPRSSIDRFVLGALEARGVRPAPPADRRTLIRRLSIDLTGLPPTPEDVDAFLDDKSPDAYERLVDRLLASPTFGERWARHWMDLARYADSNGKDENLTFHEAYRYRDYVIDSINRDKPYDQFVAEQVAGDLLAADHPDQRDEFLTATGFLVVGPKVLADRDTEKRQMDVVDEQVDTIGRVFLGLTIGCARCHDHKFDPIPTKDYYALAGILNGTTTLDGFKLGNPVVSGWSLRALGPDGDTRHEVRKAFDKAMADLTKSITKAKADATALEKSGKTDANSVLKLARAQDHVKDLQASQTSLKGRAPEAPTLVMGVRDVPSPGDLRVNVRGNPRNLGPSVPRGVLSVASRNPRPTITPGESGRRELASWLADPSNPLTARVMVNRVWMHLFGEGLTRTVDNFGAQGESPSLPELLDTLAVNFMADGWSVKRLARQIVLSQVYQLSCETNPTLVEIDPENRLFGRANRRRLDVEVIRDTILVTSGRLQRGPGAESPVASLPDRAVDNDSKGGVPTDGNPRRSVYLPIIRNDLPAMFEAFDFADPEVATGQRSATTVPAQALFLLNSKFAIEQARQTAERLLARPGDDETRLDDLYRHTLARPPTPTEALAAREFLQASRSGGDSDLDAWSSVCQAVFGCTEFRFVE